MFHGVRAGRPPGQDLAGMARRSVFALLLWRRAFVLDALNPLLEFSDAFAERAGDGRNARSPKQDQHDDQKNEKFCLTDSEHDHPLRQWNLGSMPGAASIRAGQNRSTSRIV